MNALPVLLAFEEDQETLGVSRDSAEPAVRA